MKARALTCVILVVAEARAQALQTVCEMLASARVGQTVLVRGLSGCEQHGCHLWDSADPCKGSTRRLFPAFTGVGLELLSKFVRDQPPMWGLPLTDSQKDAGLRLFYSLQSHRSTPYPITVRGVLVKKPTGLFHIPDSTFYCWAEGKIQSEYACNPILVVQEVLAEGP